MTFKAMVSLLLLSIFMVCHCTHAASIATNTKNNVAHVETEAGDGSPMDIPQIDDMSDPDLFQDLDFENDTMKASVHSISSVAAKAGCIRLFTGDVIRLSGVKGNYLEPLPATLISKDPISALASWEKRTVQAQLFKVEVVNARKATIKLRSVATKKFLHTDSYHFGLTFASLGADASVYRIVPSSSAGKIRLQDVESSQFLVGNENYGTFYEFSKSAFKAVNLGVTFVRTGAMKSVIVSSCVVLRQGDRIALMASDGTYYKRFYPFPRRPLSGLIAYLKRIDHFSKFTVVVKDASRLYLRADNKQYLKRFCCWKGLSVIAISQHKGDNLSLFRFRALSGSRALMITENNKFVTLRPESYGKLGASVVLPKPHTRNSAVGIFFL